MSITNISPEALLDTLFVRRKWDAGVKTFFGGLKGYVESREPAQPLPSLAAKRAPLPSRSGRLRRAQLPSFASALPTARYRAGWIIPAHAPTMIKRTVMTAEPSHLADVRTSRSQCITRSAREPRGPKPADEPGPGVRARLIA